MDLIRFVNHSGGTLEQGDVVVFGDNTTSLFYGPDEDMPIPEIDVTEHPYDTRVCGVVSEVHAELKIEDEQSASLLPQTKKASKAKKTRESQRSRPSQPQVFTPEEMATLDRTKIESGQMGWLVTFGLYAHCKVDADIAPIKPGDLLTTSSTKGHAQKVLDPTQAIGAIVGKALGSLEKGKGKISVLVMLQ